MTRICHTDAIFVSQVRLRFAGVLKRIKVSFHLVILAAAPALSAAEPDSQNSRDAYAEWVGVRETIARETRVWAEQKQSLNDTIELLRTEIEAMKEKSATLDETVSAAVAEREKFEAEIAGLKEASETVAQALPGMEARLQSLTPGFPAPLADVIQPLLNRLPKDDASTQASISERMQTVAGILNQADRFNGEAVVTAELRSNEAGEEVRVRTLYFGFGHAWFVGDKEAFAGVGYPTADGWQWTPQPGAGPRIARAIAIQENAATAAYVELPVSIK